MENIDNMLDGLFGHNGIDFDLYHQEKKNLIKNINQEIDQEADKRADEKAEEKVRNLRLEDKLKQKRESEEKVINSLESIAKEKYHLISRMNINGKDVNAKDFFLRI